LCRSILEPEFPAGGIQVERATYGLQQASIADGDLALIPGSTEPFSSLDLADLKDVNGLGQLPGPPGAAAEFTQDAAGLELGVGAFPRGP
jgi:hypothetical protein